ncbi:MAG: thiamine phosphate synthase [Deltaproteobacteria bacterium]|nr:thiamine phosphate synthase [Deltaproteobacteria bacterium]
MKEPSHWDVYLVTDRGLSRGRTTAEIVEAAVSGGVSVVQLREKGLETRAFYEEGLKIVDFLRFRGIPLIINDRLDIALALDADGVHLGRDDMPLAVARRILGPEKIIGISINTSDHINEEAVRLADYLAVSPVFFTGTKEDITTPWELEGVKRARSLTDLPLVGIGGINRENAADAVSAGIDCVAVVSAIVSADDPEEATRDLKDRVRSAKRVRMG